MRRLLNIKLNIAQRLVVSYGIIAVLSIFAFVTIYLLLDKSSKIADKNLNVIIPSAHTVNELYMMTANSKMLIKNWAFVDKHDDTPDKLRLKQIHKVEYFILEDKLTQLSKYWGEEEKSSLERIKKAIADTLFPLHQQIMTSLSSFEDYSDPIVMFEVYPMLGEEGIITTTTGDILYDLEELNTQLSTEEKLANGNLLNSFKAFKIFVLLIGLMIAVFSTLSTCYTKRTILRSIHSLKDNLLRKSNGQFVEDEIDNREDEIGEMNKALEKMGENVRKIVKDIKSGADIVAESSRSINSSSRLIANGANLQAVSAEEVSSSIEQMTSSISNNRENSISAEKIAIAVANDVREIKKSFQETNDAMLQITEKILVVNDIAERIDLLAINAAIEAARAGENGKGFAVVASEVRNLAENSLNAALDIDEESKESVKVAENSLKMLENIIPHIEETLLKVQEISASSIEQYSGIQQVNSAIQQLSDIINQNSSAAEELSSSSDELLFQSESLLKSISFFKTNKEDNDAMAIKLEEEIKKLQEILIMHKNNKTISDEEINSRYKRRNPSDNFDLDLMQGQEKIKENYNKEDDFTEKY